MATNSHPTPAPKAVLTTPVAASGQGAKAPMPATTYIAIVAVIAGLAVVICGIIASHLIKDIVIDTKVITGDSQAKSALNTKLSNAKSVVSNYNKLGSTKQLIADALPNDSDFPQLVAMMESMSNNASVQLKSVAPAAADTSNAGDNAVNSTPATAVANGPATPYVFSVEVSGQYPQIVAFFRDLELSARPMRVLSASFVSASGTLDTTVSVQTYYQPQASIGDKTEAVK